MKATLRKRLIDNGTRESLRLDIYPPAPHPETEKLTRWINLGLYLHVKPKNTEERQENKETLLLANAIQAKTQLQLQAGQYGFLLKQKPVNFFDYYAEYLKKKVCSPSTKSIYRTALVHLKAFSNGNNLYLTDFNKKFLQDFRAYLLTKMKINSASCYFLDVRTVLNAAYKDGNLKTKVTELVPGIRQEKTKLLYMTQEELNILNRTPCKSPTVKKAALFSAMTGMRFSDLKPLKWEDVQKDDAGYFIHFKQQKTGGMNYLPISDHAVKFLGTPKEGIIFPRIKSQLYTLNHFRNWINAAGIEKHVTFHTFRHTFATLQLLGNTNLKTLSEMLGHKNLETTMVYAHVIDSTKRSAANLITIDLCPEEKEEGKKKRGNKK